MPVDTCFTERISKQSVDIPDLETIASRTNVLDAFCEGTSVGKGLFAAEAVEEGSIVAAFSGNWDWHEENDEGHFPYENPYVITLGVYTVRGPLGRGICSRYLACDASAFALSYDMLEKGHFINTCHPRSLDPQYRYPNCIWAVLLDDFQLDCKVKPNAYLYVKTCRDVKKHEQLLLDYHWLLAVEKGHWCLDRNCGNCVDGLSSFFQKSFV